VRHCRSARRFHCRQFQRPIFGEFSKSADYPLSETDPETSNRFITRTPRGIPSFLRQSLVLVKRCRNVEFDLPKTKTKNFTVGGILKIGVTFRSNSAFYSETFATLDSPRREEHSHQDW
jgi:hypothetical protein